MALKIPSQDKRLVEILIRYAHIVKLQDLIGHSHAGNSLTKGRLQNNDFATFAVDSILNLRWSHPVITDTLNIWKILAILYICTTRISGP